MPPTSNIPVPEYEVDEDELITGEAVALDLRPASFILRAAGALIDGIVYIAFFLGVMMVVSASLLGETDDALTAAITLSLIVLCFVGVPLTVETLTHGRSVGKLAVGARIVRDDGGAIGFRHALIRALTGFLELYGTFGGVAALVALFNGRTKRLGDLVAGTYSQNERVTYYPKPVFGVPASLIEWAQTADVARMPDPLARRVSTFLNQASELTPDTRNRLSRSLADQVSVYVSPVPATNAELFLAAVTAIRRDREYAALRLERANLARLAPALDGMPRGFPDRG
ncbi:MAG: RDD family protein [Salinibacterium sp.]|nr:MAG: RDD family protein [Salinibacterium sp.]